MSVLAAGVDCGDGSPSQPHDLLGAKAQWSIPFGAAHILPLRWAGRALIGLAVVGWLVWSEALLAQAWSGRGPAPWFGLGVAALAGVPWLKLMRRLWQSLANSSALPLQWGGLPLRIATAKSNDEPAGWSLRGWPHPVSVNVVFDLGPWVLVQVTTSLGRGLHTQAWLWVDAQLSFQGAAGHHLRALLFSLRANEVGKDQAAAADKPTVMASSGDIQRQWSNLLSSFKTADQNGKGHRQADSPSAASRRGDFAPTVILEPLHRSEQRAWHS